MILAFVGSEKTTAALVAREAEARGATDGDHIARRYANREHAVVFVRAPSEVLPRGAQLGRAPLPFADVLVVESAPSLVVTRSGFGGRPVYLRVCGDGALASTDLGWLVRVSRDLQLPVTLDPDALAARCAHLPAYGDRSIYTEISEVPPGSRATITKTGWSLTRLSPPSSASDDASAGDLLEVLTRAVGSAAGTAPTRLGILTGGGLDSGALLAIARALGHDVNAFAIDFAGDDSDRPYLAALCRAHDLTPSRVSVGEQTFELGVEAAGLPLTWPSGALEATLLARARQWGAAVVLSGAFADASLDGDPEAASRVILRGGVTKAIAIGRAFDYASLAAGARRALLPHVRRFVPAPVRRALRALRGQRDRPAVRAFDGPRLRRAREDAWARARDVRAPIELDAEARLTRAFFSPELALLAELRAQEEALSGVLRVDPYLCQGLQTFALSLRPEVLLANGRRRGLFRDAVTDLLPAALVERAGKASFRPLHAALLAGDRHELPDSFSSLAALGIVDGAAANQALAHARLGGSEHDGELLSLLGSESWLARGSA